MFVFNTERKVAVNMDHIVQLSILPEGDSYGIFADFDHDDSFPALYIGTKEECKTVMDIVVDAISHGLNAIDIGGKSEC